MSMFSTDIRVANTAAPSFQSQANVGQYGWTGADQGHYNQLIQYVDECRKIWIDLQEKIAYIEGLITQVEGIDAQVQYINLVAAEMSKWRTEVLAARDQVETMYNNVVPLYTQFNIDYTDFSKKYTQVVQLHSETVVAAGAAALSETNAAKSAKEAADVAEELRKGQVYRGTWNIQSNAAYPPKPDTNSVWDIVLNEGSLEFKFDNTTWYWGDRLLFLKDDDKYTQIEAGGSVTSVNGKKGAVTLTREELHAAPDDYGLGGYGKSLSNKSANDVDGSGFYGVFSATTDTPYSSNGPSGSQILNMEWGAAGATQLFSSYTADRLHFRRKYTNAWQDWVEIYTTARKPTPSEIGAAAVTGTTFTGNVNMASTARLTLDNTALMGANGNAILRDHGNGNVTISASKNSTGNAGTLYLGYNAGLTGTGGYNTRDIRIDVPVTFKGSSLINEQGKIAVESITNGVATTGSTMSGALRWIDANKYVNGSGDSLYVAAKLGRVYIEGQSTPIARVAGVDYNMYHQGFKPTAADVGALPIGGGTIAGRATIRPSDPGDPLSLVQTFNPAGPNAQGVSGYKAGAETKRIWGVGMYATNAALDYTYIGFGETPWAKGLKIKATAAEINQPLYVSDAYHVTNNNGGPMVNLNYGSGEGGLIRGIASGARDWYVGRTNAAGDVALYSYVKESGIILREGVVEVSGAPRVGGAGTVFYSKPLGSTDLNTLHDVAGHGMWYQDATANATAARNYPTQEAGSLIVMGSAYGACQEFTGYSSGRKFVRGKVSAGSAAANWNPWKELGGVKDHCSAYRITAQTIAAGATSYLVPGVFGSAQGITSSNGIFTILKSGTYKIDWGFSIEPTSSTQNGVGSIFVNGAKTYDAMIYNYCPISNATNGAQMTTSSTSVIVKLNSGDRVQFGVNAVNSTSVRIYQAGYMTFTQL